MLHSSPYIHYVHRHPIQSSSPTTDPKFLASLLERSRAQRDTYDERQKLLSTYKIISRTQCLLQMRPTDGYVDAKHVSNLEDTQETRDGKKSFSETKTQVRTETSIYNCLNLHIPSRCVYDIDLGSLLSRVRRMKVKTSY